MLTAVAILISLVPARGDSALERLIGRGRHPAMRWEWFSDVQEEAKALYQRNGWGPLWIVGGRPTSSARALLGSLATAGDAGLDPEDYDATRLGALATTLDRGGADQQQALRFDAALTIGALRFVAALARGRVDPAAAHATFSIDRGPLDLSATVDQLRNSTRPELILQSIEPPWSHYQLLKRALGRYRQLARDTTLLRLQRPPRGGVREGGAYQGAAGLRRLLAAFDDLTSTATGARTGDTVLTPELVDGIRRFQIRQGFRADGILGDSTWSRLVRPIGQHIRQMTLTLERWRWLPRAFTSPPILINIPAFRLHFFTTQTDDEETVLSMNVVVGEAYKNNTPVFAEELRYLIFRPYWEVPPSIMRDEIRPKAMADSTYLMQHYYELVRGDTVVAPTPENVIAIGRSVRVRQLPGPWNSLGSVKFMLPNNLNIYLHDTPARSLFDRARRDFSHGCIRVADPVLLAELVLRDQPAWTPARIRAAMSASTPMQVNLGRRIPVLVLYGTAIARENGQVFFYQDIYGHDKALQRMLAAGYPYPRK
jgi:murein L,D-transpeptidase YcbB/YkuD